MIYFALESHSEPLCAGLETVEHHLLIHLLLLPSSGIIGIGSKCYELRPSCTLIEFLR